MSNLVAEILLRFVKPVLALVAGAIVYGLLTGPLGAPGSPELALLAWLAGAALVLLLESSPI